ncbi:hypothetical protein BS47DRAFT_1095862 [Hydnum rufescens UP504]|uniref:Uncharacterized protein n=1 Tax=Hydnum rufescens UP504 TaxID=1448309 RepID=A0A9P6AUF0_9AGAM|nr:hypothetical protein BS47DRAFT_1095862 [Hydnum rufescens UP504]
MPNWNSVEEQQHDIQAFARVCLVFLGVYAWEFLITLDSDFQILCGKRKFRPAQLVYFACRYSLLGFLIGLNVAMEISSPIDCTALYRWNDFTMGGTLGFSSMLLMMRSLVVWEFDKRVLVPLVVLSLGQWAIIFRNIISTHASFNELAGTCAVDAMFRNWMTLEFIITMVVDFVILLVTVVGILLRLKMKSNVRELILNDGIMYFCCAFLANLVPVVIMLLKLNPIMDFMGLPVATTVCGIASTRSVRHLTGIRVIASAPAGSMYSSGNSSGPPSYKAQRKGPLTTDATDSLSFSTESFPGQPVKAHLSSKVEQTPASDLFHQVSSKRKDLDHSAQVTQLTWQGINVSSTVHTSTSPSGDMDLVSPESPSEEDHEAPFRDYRPTPERMV